MNEMLGKGSKTKTRAAEGGMQRRSTDAMRDRMPWPSSKTASV